MHSYITHSQNKSHLLSLPYKYPSTLDRQSVPVPVAWFNCVSVHSHVYIALPLGTKTFLSRRHGSLVNMPSMFWKNDVSCVVLSPWNCISTRTEAFIPVGGMFFWSRIQSNRGPCLWLPLNQGLLCIRPLSTSPISPSKIRGEPHVQKLIRYHLRLLKSTVGNATRML